MNKKSTITPSKNFFRLADFVLGQGNKDIPQSAIDMAALLLVDTLAVAAGAARLEATKIARDFSCDFINAGKAEDRVPILFDGRMASLPGAAFAAATQIDNLDGHDGYNPTKGHIGCAIIPALFAFTHKMPELSARQALKAMVIGYEVAARAAIALHETVSDYHTSGAWNGLGVAALGCHLRQSNADILRHALGIAEYHGPRSQMMREIDNPTHLHDGSGMGAFVGVKAVLMAERGFKGAPAITVEGKEEEAYWQDLGSNWTIEKNYIKPYPICRWAHPAIDCARKLMHEHEIAAEDIQNIIINTFYNASRLYAGAPQSTEIAQYALPFPVALMFCHGRIGPEHISGAGLADKKAIALIDRISVQEKQGYTERYPDGRWADMTVKLKDGREFFSGEVHARGGPEAPMELGEIKEKFHTILGGALSEKRAKALWQMHERLLDDKARFCELNDLVFPAIDGRLV